jgi:hypothetical protein
MIGLAALFSLNRGRVMSNVSSGENGYAYIAARARVEHHVARLADARRIEVIVEVDPGRASSGLIAHQIQFTYGSRKRVVGVDHDTFMDEKFFRTLVLHQVEAVIEDLASGADATLLETKSSC